MTIVSVLMLLYSCGDVNKKSIIDTKNTINIKEIVSTGSVEIFVDKEKVYDLELDDSITKFVDNKIHFNDLEYIPENLVDIKSEHILDIKGNQQVRQITLDNLELLSNDFYNTFGKELKIVSAYRSYRYQKGIKDRGCSDLFCAKAGYSEHQSGLAVDLWEATNKDRFEEDILLKRYFNWVKIKGPEYGFTNTYQKGLEVDGYAVEPWHWRYVGVELATYLKKEEITFAEYYYKLNK